MILGGSFSARIEQAIVASTGEIVSPVQTGKIDRDLVLAGVVAGVIDALREHPLVVLPAPVADELDGVTVALDAIDIDKNTDV